ncbi:MAG: ATP-binding cassette domain-containing protein [bacterium]
MFLPVLKCGRFSTFRGQSQDVPKLEIAAQTSAVLESVCLDEERRKLTAELSMGMRKKLAIAGSLLGNPKIIFLDEALNGIDLESAFKIKHVLQDLVAGGRTIILSSHVLEVIEKICDRYLVLKNGEIIADLEANRFKETDLAGKDMDLEKYIIQLLET